MSSKAQKEKGYPIPEAHQTEATRQLCLIIPDDDGFQAAVYYQLYSLGKWWNWHHNENPPTLRAKETAETWRLLWSLEDDCMALTKEDICEAVLCAAEKLSTRILLGQAGNFTDGATIEFDEEGNPIVDIEEGGTGGGSGTTQEQRNGGVYNIILEYQKFLDDIRAWWNSSLTEGQIKDRVNAIYLVDETAMGLVLDDWFATDPPPAAVIYTFPSDAAAWLYCKGYTQQDIAAFLVDDDPANLFLMLEFTEAFLPEQFTTWYQRGTDTPATDYITYSCTPMPDENLILLINGANGSINTTNTQKTFHRLLFEVSGKVQHPTEGDRYFDFFYENDGGVVTYRGGVNISRFGGGIDEPSQSKVPYNPAGTYRFTLDITAGSGVVTIAKNLVSGFPAVTTIGQFTINIKDFGEFAV